MVEKAEWWLWTLAYVLLSAVGGGLGHIMRQLDKGASVMWLRVLFEMACAAFAGVLVMLACQAMGMSAQWTGITVGVFGWIGGSAAMRYLERLVARKLTVEQPTGDEHGPAQ